MRKRLVKALTILVSAMLLLAVLAGCGGSNAPATTAAAAAADTQAAATTAAPATEKANTVNGIDISKKVEIQFWMLGDPPKDLPAVNDEVNKLAEQDLNCTVKYNMTTWTDWTQKYKMLLASGQPIDLIFTAEWTDYQKYAKAGAFMALDDLMPKAAPDLWKWIPQTSWDGVKIGGKIYTIPATWKEYVYDGFMYRKDLQEKYGLPEPKDLATIEAYLDGIKANEKGMTPIADISDGQNFMGTYSMVSEMLHPWLDRNMPNISEGLYADNATPSVLKPYYGSDLQKADLELAKKWADKGYWSKSVLSSKNADQASFENGNAGAVMSGLNPVKFNTSSIKIASNHPDWKVGYLPYANVSGVVHPVHPTHNGFAVPVSSQNPERAIMFYSKMVLDKKYNYLTEYGIEGKNYTIENGYYKMLGDQTSNGFQREGMCGWAWRNPEIQLFDPSFDTVKAIFAELDKIQTPDLQNGFAEDYATYQSERTAVLQVCQQYLVPLQAGLVKDVGKGIQEFMAKAKAAGLDKVQAEYTKQWQAYCTDMGIK